MVETLSIAVIGAPAVGKTSIIRQFIYNDFSEGYTATRTRYVYRPSVILNGNMYELKILDVPPIASFPASASQEWMDLRCRGVRNANAYILVYDICCVESFEYVKMIRQQIVENREGSSNEVPILVVGNKRDLQRQRFMPRRAVSVLSCWALLWQGAFARTTPPSVCRGLYKGIDAPSCDPESSLQPSLLRGESGTGEKDF
uniref:RAS-like, family 10, member A n=1 Tax=Oryzias latipes TaxID=8090 RepID=A0A3P9IVW3_ORYLA